MVGLIPTRLSVGFGAAPLIFIGHVVVHIVQANVGGGPVVDVIVVDAIVADVVVVVVGCRG